MAKARHVKRPSNFDESDYYLPNKSFQTNIYDDPDGDGINNIEEQRFDTSALIPDSDGDGFTDGLEVEQRSDPNNPWDHKEHHPPPEMTETADIEISGLLKTLFILNQTQAYFI